MSICVMMQVLLLFGMVQMNYVQFFYIMVIVKL